MARQLASSLQTKLAGSKLFAADLVELHLSTPLYFTTTNIDIDFDSATAPDAGANTYLAQGQFLFFGNVVESSAWRIPYATQSSSIPGICFSPRSPLWRR